jgi:cell division protein FtsB
MARRGASKREQRPVVMPAESAPEHWLRSIHLSGFTVLMLGLVVLAVVVLAPGLRIFFEQRAQLVELEQSVGDKQQAVDELGENLARWDDPAYIVSQARERLLYVFPGEYNYLVINEADVANTLGGVPISTEVQFTKVDWVATLLGSVYTAGLTQAPAEELTGPEQ